MDSMWYDIDCEDLSERIAKCLGTSMYNTRLKELFIDGSSFFRIAEGDWKLFFDTVEVKKFSHMISLKKWASECNERHQIINEAPGLAPIDQGSRSKKLMAIETIMARTISTVTQSKGTTSKFSDPASKENSPCDSVSGRSSKGFFPSADEIFKPSMKSGGREILKTSHPEAYKSHLMNFKIVRSWFDMHDTDPVLRKYLIADFKSDTKCKEECRSYVQSLMHELLPLRFKCPETEAKHEIPWPESFLFEVVLNRKHEWKKGLQKKCTGKDDESGPSKEVRETEVTLDKDEEEAIMYCKDSERYALDLYAFEFKQGLAKLKDRESVHLTKEEINDQCHKSSTKCKPLAFHGGALFGRGMPISVHVLDSVRCWKIRYISTRFTKPRDNKRVKHLWVPLMKPAKDSAAIMNEVQVDQLKPGMEYYIPRTHCSMTPVPPLIRPVSSTSHGSGNEESEVFKKEDSVEDPGDTEAAVATPTVSYAESGEEHTQSKTDIVKSDDTVATERISDDHSSERLNMEEDSHDSKPSRDPDWMLLEQEPGMCDSNKDYNIEPEVKRQKKEATIEDTQRAQIRKGETKLHIRAEVKKNDEDPGVLTSSNANVYVRSGKVKTAAAGRPGKENAPKAVSFNAISTSLHVKARQQLLKGTIKCEKAKQVEEAKSIRETRGRRSTTDVESEDEAEVEIDFEKLTPVSKQVVCMKAMGLLTISAVEMDIKGWISGMNNKSAANKPFKGHSRMDPTALVSMVAKWSIETKFVIIRDPPELSMDGAQRLFPENVKRKNTGTEACLIRGRR